MSSNHNPPTLIELEHLITAATSGWWMTGSFTKRDADRAAESGRATLSAAYANSWAGAIANAQSAIESGGHENWGPVLAAVQNMARSDRSPG